MLALFAEPWDPARPGKKDRWTPAVAGARPDEPSWDSPAARRPGCMWNARRLRWTDWVRVDVMGGGRPGVPAPRDGRSHAHVHNGRSLRPGVHARRDGRLPGEKMSKSRATWYSCPRCAGRVDPRRSGWPCWPITTPRIGSTPRPTCRGADPAGCLRAAVSRPDGRSAAHPGRGPRGAGADLDTRPRWSRSTMGLAGGVGGTDRARPGDLPGVDGLLGIAL